MQGLLRNPQWLFFFTQIAIWIHQAHCSYLPDHLEAQQYAAQKSFPLFERPIGFETEVLRGNFPFLYVFTKYVIAKTFRRNYGFNVLIKCFPMKKIQ